MATELREPMNLRTAMTYGLIAVLLIFGILVVLTPQSDYACDPPRRLAVKPGVLADDVPAFCVFEVPFSAKGSLLYSDKNTGECRASKKEAEEVFRDMVAKERSAFHQCVITRPSPPEATLQYLKRTWQKVAG